jgi:hypothetical protein
MGHLAHRIGFGCWLGFVTLLWAVYPCLLSPSRTVVLFAVCTGVLGLVGWLTTWQMLVVWSGGLGLFNLTLALLLASTPPNIWVGLVAGCTLLALLDGSHHFTYLRHCQVEPGVLAALSRVLLCLVGISLLAGVVLGVLVTQLPWRGAAATASGSVTIVGAGLFVGFLALFLLATRRS